MLCHQIIAASLGGKVTRADDQSQMVSTVYYQDGREVNALFTHQDHVTDPEKWKLLQNLNIVQLLLASIQLETLELFNIQKRLQRLLLKQ